MSEVHCVRFPECLCIGENRRVPKCDKSDCPGKHSWADVLPETGHPYLDVIDDLAWDILRSLHANVPESDRPQSWSDLNEQQEKRIRAAAESAIRLLAFRLPLTTCEACAETYTGGGVCAQKPLEEFRDYLQRKCVVSPGVEDMLAKRAAERAPVIESINKMPGAPTSAANIGKDGGENCLRCGGLCVYREEDGWARVECVKCGYVTKDDRLGAALHSPKVLAALDLLQLEQRGRAQAFRLLDQARSVSDPATLAKADAYEECGNELKSALSPKSRHDDMVECPACRNWMVERVCKYCNGSGEVTEQQFRDFGSEP